MSQKPKNNPSKKNPTQTSIQKPQAEPSGITDLDEYDMLMVVSIKLYDKNGLVRKFDGVSTIVNATDPLNVNTMVPKFNRIFEGVVATPFREVVSRIFNRVNREVRKSLEEENPVPALPPQLHPETEGGSGDVLDIPEG